MTGERLWPLTASWSLAASVHQADIDHGKWSSRPCDPHAVQPASFWIAGPGVMRRQLKAA